MSWSRKGREAPGGETSAHAARGARNGVQNRCLWRHTAPRVGAVRRHERAQDRGPGWRTAAAPPGRGPS
eukprot:scaffold35641_cov129-Isochrysis_galbana.AAC.1